MAVAEYVFSSRESPALTWSEFLFLFWKKAYLHVFVLEEDIPSRVFVLEEALFLFLFWKKAYLLVFLFQKKTYLLVFVLDKHIPSCFCSRKRHTFLFLFQKNTYLQLICVQLDLIIWSVQLRAVLTTTRVQINPILFQYMFLKLRKY